MGRCRHSKTARSAATPPNHQIRLSPGPEGGGGLWRLAFTSLLERWIPAFPFHENAILAPRFHKTVSLTLSIVNEFPSIAQIEINGRFSATCVPHLDHILGLSIEALNRAGPGDDPAIQSFLLAFGKLQRLRICLSGPSRAMCCERLTWRHLSYLELAGLQISPKAPASLLRRHKELRRIIMTNVRLQGGAGGWDEFVSAVAAMSRSWACSYSGGTSQGTMTRDP